MQTALERKSPVPFAGGSGTIGATGLRTRLQRSCLDITEAAMVAHV